MATHNELSRGGGRAEGPCETREEPPQFMKVAVVGCGALGSFYGAKLGRAGREVHFLLRSDYDVVKERGVEILSPDGDFTVRPTAAARPEEIGPSDLVLIGLKTTANSAFAELITPLVGADTSILTLQNGLGNEAELAALFGPGVVMGGLCFVCLNRVNPGVIQHLAHGQIVIGEYQRVSGSRTNALAAMFEEAGVPCRVTDDLEKARWQKLVWNIPFNGLGVAGAAGYEAVVQGRIPAGQTSALGACLTTDKLLEAPHWKRHVLELMEEVIATAQHLGFDIPYELAEKQVNRTYEMGAYKASTLIDFERGQPLELEHLFLRPMRKAEEIGMAVPRLRALCNLLTELDSARRAGDINPRPAHSV